MTLIISVIKNDGVWQSSDNRISVNNRFRDDESIKQVTIECPNGVALLAWTGLAEIQDKPKTKVSDWISEILRGETRSFDQTLELIRQAASEEIGDKYFLLITVVAFLDKRPFYFEIKNGEGKNMHLTGPLKTNFTIYHEEIKEPVIKIGGGGALHLTKNDAELLRRILVNRGQPDDFAKILAKVNKSVSKHCVNCKQTVSPSCITVYMPSTGIPTSSIIHSDGPSPKGNTPLPHIMFGIDLSQVHKGLLDWSDGKISHEEFDSIHAEALKTAVTPRLKVKP